MANYKIYELKLKPLSGWITDLTADTIFGHLCWQIKYEFGDEVLKQFLQEMENEPIFTISDVLPSDRLPRPVTEFDGDLGDLDKEDYETNQKYKKVNYVFIGVFKKYYLGKSILVDGDVNVEKIKKEVWEIKRNIENEKEYKEVIQNIENKNVINRFYGATGNNGIYSQQIYLLKNNLEKFVLYLKILREDVFNKFKKSEDGKKITIFDLIRSIFSETGYGKKKSSGKGIFEVAEDWKESKLNEFNGKNILLLSSFIPSQDDPINGNYKLFTKFPKMGEEFSIEGQNFYKKPLVMIQAGATFKKDNNYNGYVGRMLKDVAIDKNNIYHYGYGFTIEF